MPSVGCMRWIYGWEEVIRNNHRPKPRDDLLEIWQVCWPQRGHLFSVDSAPQSSTAVGFFFRQFHRMMWVMGGVFSWLHAGEVAVTFDSRGSRESRGRGTDSSRKLQGAWVALTSRVASNTISRRGLLKGVDARARKRSNNCGNLKKSRN
jgi:hypothetical protein